MNQAKIISNVSQPEKYVGFADIPNQIFRHYAMEGFDFNLMVVGEPGLGKSTFINNLFMCDIYVHTKYDDESVKDTLTEMEIRNSFSTIVEKGIKLRLNLIDTPGYGNCLDNHTNADKILSYVTQKNAEYLEWETSTNRNYFRDGRVHCCLYFIAPTGHKLKPIDLQFLTKLHDKVNLIVAIGRADSLTPECLMSFKKRIIDELNVHNIKTYQMADILKKSSENQINIENSINRSPFAIVSSESTAEVGTKHVRCRKYPWGSAEVENTQHSDFIPLRNLLLRTCTAHLVHTTHIVYYEKFRSSNDIGKSVHSAVEEEKQKFALLLETKKKEYKEKADAYNKEINTRLKDLENEYIERINLLETEIAELSATNSPNPSTSKSEIDRSASSDKKAKKK